MELGTGIGCSTEIMAFTCPNASIYTVEQNEKCIELAKQLISEKSKERIYFKYSIAGVMYPCFEVNPFINFLAYSTPYDWRNYDFILIDGPGPLMAKRKDNKTNKIWKCLAELPGGDLIFLLSKMQEGTMVYIDKRQVMVNLYRRHLSAYLDLVEKNKDEIIYTLFRRNDKQLNDDLSNFENSDLAYRELRFGGYFNK